MNPDTNPQQASRYNGVFFLHIPKTAGSSICDMFAFTFDRFLRDAQSHPDQCQELLGGDETFFAGGHFLFPRARPFIERDDLFTFTVLRDPFEQVISHLKWVKAYGNPPMVHRRAEIHPGLAELAQDLWDMPLNDARSVRDLAVAKAPRVFCNLQTRYLCEGGYCDLWQAFSNIQSLTFYFSLPDIVSAMQFVSGQVGHLEEQKTINTAMIDEQVDLEDPAIREVYREMIELDLAFYDTVMESSRSRFGIGP